MIHYQIPAAVDIYIHRCGRTARAQNEGISVALVSPKEALRFRALRKVRILIVNSLKVLIGLPLFLLRLLGLSNTVPIAILFYCL